MTSNFQIFSAKHAFQFQLTKISSANASRGTISAAKFWTGKKEAKNFGFTKKKKN